MKPTETTDCAFCRIARGEDSSAQVVAQGKRWIAFFPVKPATVGHTLVIPRRHVPDLWSADSALAADLMWAVVEVGRALQVAIEPEGMNLISSAGPAAEQTVFHLHLHVVPRWHDDQIDPIWPPRSSRLRTIPAGMADKVRSAFRQLR
jgi:histidine triad (HIT) family protein